MSRLSKSDPAVAKILRAELHRQQTTLGMIASENHISPAILEATGSVLTDKYAEGYPAKRWYRGCHQADRAERLCIQRALKLFGAEYANVQPHSGTSANLAVYVAALKGGDKIMGMRLDQGGHLSHGKATNLSGIFYKVVSYGVRKDTETLDMDEVRELALRERPNMIVVGASAYPRVLDFAAFGAIGREVGCPVLADIAHIAGLIVGGVHPDPVPHCEFVTATTHKTLRGPRGAIILCRRAWARAVDQAVFPGLQGGPLMHVIAAKAVALHEAMRPEFRQYAAAIVSNAKALAEELTGLGWRLVSGGTDNHMLLLDLRSKDPNLTGQTAAVWLAAAGIVANKNVIPFDPRPPAKASGVRLGTPAVTTRGMTGREMKQIARWVERVLTCGGDKNVLQSVRGQVEELCGQFPIPAHSQ